MNDELEIGFDWLGRETGSPIDRAFYAKISLAVGQECLTRLEDVGAQTVRSHLRGSAYRLAIWFASNWWKLRWEPKTPNWPQDADWRMAHSIGAVGGGYVWPNVLFASDGEFVEIAALPHAKAAAFEPVRYLERAQARITAAEFEKKVDSFIENILSRLHALEINDAALPELWNEVLAERSDEEAYRRRKLEAMAGFDPDKAPDAFLSRLLEDKAHLGKEALAEVAAAERLSTESVLDTIQALAKSKEPPKMGGFRGKMRSLDDKPQFIAGEAPWLSAARLAKHARKHWNFDDKPIRNKDLAALFETDPSVFEPDYGLVTRIPFALRTEKNGIFDIYFNSPVTTTRRFLAGRLIGDHLWFDKQERLLPATEAKTARQKFQRAFAQEFLCPIDQLMEIMPPRSLNDDDFSKAAEKFEVSPLMIKTTLVNHRRLDREALAWDD